jgi:hypothetical protein
LWAGILTEEGQWAALDPEWKRIKHRCVGGAVMKLIR